MIFIDMSEVRDGSTLPTIPDAICVDGLEDWSGADCLISPIDMPCSKPALMKEHIAEGACLLQIKRGFDLPASIPDHRLSLSLAKMVQMVPNAAQRWMIFIGILTNKEGDGEAWIDGRRVRDNVPSVDYKACMTAIRRWQMRGGRYANVPRLSDFGAWVKDFEADLVHFKEHPVLDVYPPKVTMQEESDDPFQMLKPVTDWRVMLVSSGAGIGPVMATELFRRARGNFAWAIDELTDTSVKGEPLKGWTPNRKLAFRKMLGLEGNQYVTSGKMFEKEKEY